MNRVADVGLEGLANPLENEERLYRPAKYSRDLRRVWRYLLRVK
jgi:hypothetical protein